MSQPVWSVTVHGRGFDVLRSNRSYLDCMPPHRAPTPDSQTGSQASTRALPMLLTCLGPRLALCRPLRRGGGWCSDRHLARIRLRPHLCSLPGAAARARTVALTVTLALAPALTPARPHLHPLPHQLPPFHPHHKMTLFHHQHPLSLISKPLKKYHITTFLIAVGCHRNLMMPCCRGWRRSHGRNVVLHHSHFLNSHPHSPHPQLFYLGLCRFTPHDHNHTFTPFISSKCH